MNRIGTGVGERLSRGGAESAEAGVALFSIRIETGVVQEGERLREIALPYFFKPPIR